ncbi:molybdate transport system regulatory protein [Mucilaginibacter yixingensis]|uniref:Molybdate transport system regulatory protein n=1 Tax=Mucilaginibacter yixingensis TaxID=1295612 RepID=A0A2T5J8E8_9SPHI|nr:winged helix-turn-helix domain-containing protein [Mucilaginibacter yixingensis]PTQ95669.1 molybdate transport system regulatory protein [Mucilaginibacter yixingensis]
MPPSFKYNGKLWIENGTERLLGPGRVELLERIQQTGSIRQAAMQMQMSYRQAWQIVAHLNTQFGEPIVVSHRGGKGGGYAEITPKGLAVMKIFRDFHQQFHAFLDAHTQELIANLTTSVEK